MPLSDSLPLPRAPQPPPAPITPESITAEHRALHATVGALERALQPAPDDPAWRTRLLSRLGQLQQQLEDHFSAEEQSGLYEDLAEACPQHAGAALRLRGEHDDLRRRVELLFGEAGGTSVGELRELASRVRGMLRDLRHHESRENELLSDTLDDGGLGVGD